VIVSKILAILKARFAPSHDLDQNSRSIFKEKWHLVFRPKMPQTDESDVFEKMETRW
jgi:hypothetical protein